MCFNSVQGFQLSLFQWVVVVMVCLWDCTLWGGRWMMLVFCGLEQLCRANLVGTFVAATVYFLAWLAPVRKSQSFVFFTRESCSIEYLLYFTGVVDLAFLLYLDAQSV
jgi:hypothetical protein